MSAGGVPGAGAPVGGTHGPVTGSLRLPLQPHGPWLLLTPDVEPVEDLAAPVRRAGGAVRRLNGLAMRDEAGLHAEVARSLGFPSYYGRNWSALEDCLVDLAWLPAPAYLLVVESAQDVLAEEPDERVGLLGDLLVRVARFWSSPVEDGDVFDRRAVPFHVVLVTLGELAARETESRWSAQGVRLHRL